MSNPPGMSNRPGGVLALTWHLARSEGRRGLQGHLLAAGAAAVSALVLLLLLAANLGAEHRAAQDGWRHPDAAANGSARERISQSSVQGKVFAVISFAQLPGKPATAAPPGVAAFPRPGQVFLSPALKRLVEHLPAGQFADRFGPDRGRSFATIGRAALKSPDELVAFVGLAPSDPSFSASLPQGAGGEQIATLNATISGFTGHTTVGIGADQTRALMLTGAALLIVPVSVLAGSAGRLSAARREQRLAALRLAGATPRQILSMTAAESATTGLLGAVAAAAVYLGLLPVLARTHFAGGAWFTGDLWVGLPFLMAAAVVICLLSTLSAVTALRQVMVSPLGVAQQQNPRRTGMIRLVVFLLLIFGIWLTAHTAGGGSGTKLGLLVAFYAAIGLIGPWVVDRLGRLMALCSRRPATLLAARRLSDDPRGAWRTVSGLVLVGFVAGFFSVAHLEFADLPGAPNQVAVAVPMRSAPIVTRQAERRLETAGIAAAVAVDPDSQLIFNDGDVVALIATVSGGPAAIDSTITALTGLVPGQDPVTPEQRDELGPLSEGLRQTSIAALVLGFVIAITSAGLTAAATVLDRRRIYGLLRLAGTPLKVLDRARVRETLIPLVVLAGGTTGAGSYAGIKINNTLGASVDGRTTTLLGACLAIGATSMFGAIALSKPLLHRITNDAIRNPD